MASIGSPKEVGEAAVLTAGSAAWLPYSLGWDPAATIGSEPFVMVATGLAGVGIYTSLDTLDIIN
ncbi:hypothetical protein [Halodesulfurarchaeum formicicum]|uniref:hypothetical protein n=1 Tax=Halodesulfurarchaeum formicicum TaxID=1873524 RepID=UPI0012FDDF5E|nr:hypothetical protein [Halodesulfurarchaeum formicicum]